MIIAIIMSDRLGLVQHRSHEDGILYTPYHTIYVMFFSARRRSLSQNALMHTKTLRSAVVHVRIRWTIVQACEVSLGSITPCKFSIRQTPEDGIHWNVVEAISPYLVDAKYIPHLWLQPVRRHLGRYSTTENSLRNSRRYSALRLTVFKYHVL